MKSLKDFSEDEIIIFCYFFRRYLKYNGIYCYNDYFLMILDEYY